MDVKCPYCSVTVDVVSLETHVRSMDDEAHGSQGSVPVQGVDNPWNLRVDVSGSRDCDPGRTFRPPSTSPTRSARAGVRPASGGSSG